MHTQGPGEEAKLGSARDRPLFTHPAAPGSRPREGFPAARGLVAPHEPPASRGTRGRKGRSTRATRWTRRRPQRQDAPSARPEGSRQGPLGAAGGGDPEKASRHTHLEQRPPPLRHGRRRGGSSWSRKPSPPPPEGTSAAPGSAAKPCSPEGAVVAAAAAAEAQSSPGRIGSRAAAPTRDPGSTAEPGRGLRLRRDNRGAADRQPRRSLLQRCGGRSSHPRCWATAPPGPHVRLRRRDCGGRAGHERQGTLRSAAWGWRGPRASCAARSPPLTTFPESRKPRFPPTPGGPHPSQTSAPFPSLQKVRESSGHLSSHLSAGVCGNQLVSSVVGAGGTLLVP
uniref:Proline-rich protein 2-like n=1 Tax=Castor canadensis TaxID=51338 RepID=A0A8B7W670_CASCN|nr:proline-rich protein 2-like [Castor canadensis]